MCCYVFFGARANPAKVMEDDKQLIPVVSNDTVVNDPRQVKNNSRREMEVLKGAGALVAFSSILSNKDQVSQNHCEVQEMRATRILREPWGDILCRLLLGEVCLCPLREEGRGTPDVF